MKYSSLFSQLSLCLKNRDDSLCSSNLQKIRAGFTLVELIIVITILAILALVAFLMMSDATVSARDSNRLASIKNIYDASHLQAVQERLLPLPDQAITLTVSGTDIGWQGYMSGYVAQAYGYSDSVYDPRDNTPYIYRVNQARNKSQYLAYLENGGEVSRGDILVAFGGFGEIERVGGVEGVRESKSFAGLTGLGIDTAQATDFSKRVPYVYGDRLGVVLSKSSNEGANALLGSGGTLDLGGNTIDSNYSVYVNESLKLSSIEGTGATALKSGNVLDDLIAGATIVASSGSGSSGSGSGGGGLDCGLTPQEVSEMNAVKGEGYTAQDWCTMTSIDWSNLGLLALPSAVVKLQHLEVLNLTSNALSGLPLGFSSLTQLHVLNFYQNSFATVPSDIQYLLNIRELYFDYNSISSVPEFIGNLNNLTDLSFWHNQITTIPDSVVQLTHLTYLDFDENTSLGALSTWWSNGNYGEYTESAITTLGQDMYIYFSEGDAAVRIGIGTPPPLSQSCILTQGEVDELNTITGNNFNSSTWCNQISLNIGNLNLDHLPTGVPKLNKLQNLYIDRNQITTLPGSMSGMTALHTLIAYDNLITTIPVSICSLSSLQNLNLRNNQISSIPDQINGLVNLNELNLSDNYLTSLPENIGYLNHLIALEFTNNLLTYLPDSIGNLSGKLQFLFLGGNTGLGNLNYNFAYYLQPQFYYSENNISANGSDISIEGGMDIYGGSGINGQTLTITVYQNSGA